MKRARQVALEVVGWVLVVAGIAALVLPGPGLLMIFAGMAILSQRYEWAEKRLRPVEVRAMRGAADSVETWPRIVMSTVFALLIMATGVLWLLQPGVPGWWPLAERWWLPGGLWTGITLIGSGVIALALIVWSYRQFHGNPEAVAKIEERAASN